MEVIDPTTPARMNNTFADTVHWHNALMEPPEIERGETARFSPNLPSMIAAKSELLPVIFMIASGTIASLADLHSRNARLATQWLCGDGMTMTVNGYHFAVLECGGTGNCQGTYVGFQRAVHDLRQMNGPTTPEQHC